MCKQPSGGYDQKTDVQFFADEPDAWLSTESGAFAIFFPEDAHMPSRVIYSGDNMRLYFRRTIALLALILLAGVSNEVRRNLVLFADYNAELRGSEETAHAFVGGARYTW